MTVAPIRKETERLLQACAPDYSDAQIDAIVDQRRQAVALVAGDALGPAVMFVCVHNAGRSQMSAGFARAYGAGWLTVFSAGSAPGPTVNPVAVEAMREVGIDIAAQAPTPILPDMVEASTVVVTMGCGDACPYFPDTDYRDWALTDPHGADIELIRGVRDEISERVRALVDELADHRRADSR